MKFVSILREAALNTTTGTSKAQLFAVVLALVLTLLSCADMATVADIGHQAERFRLSGGSTITYTLRGQINGQACDALSQVPGVLAAGAIRQSAVGETASALPGEQIPTFEVSPSFSGFQALGRPRPGQGVMISVDLARTLGIHVGQRINLADGSPIVSSVYSYATDGRVPGYGYAIFIPQDTTAPFDACWVELWPVSNSLTALLPTTLLPGATATAASAGTGPQLQQLNASLGTSFDGVAQFNNRITRFAPSLAALAGLSLGFVSIRRRRLELAAARHARITRAAQAWQAFFETAAWTLIGGVLSIPGVTILLVIEHSAERDTLISLALHVILAGISAALVGAIIAVLLIQEKQLFQYFRER